MALDSGTRLGPYEILAKLGEGGMGEVYRARDTRLDRLVAVKILPADSASPHAFERFEREARAIAALNHPGICAIYDVGSSPVPFLVMELLDGETLHQRLTGGPIDVSTLVDTGVAMADALASAHGKGIVHRDLKPANIVLTARGPKVLDFGLARVTEAISADGAATVSPTLSAHGPITDAGVAVGTVAYMSPEQLRGETLDARTDLFSLGLVLYEMATGRRAFSGTTSAMTSAAILHEEPVSARQLRPDLPPRLEQAIVTLLEKDREIRTQTASELRAELTRIKRELSGSRTPESVPSISGAGAAASGTAVAPVVAPPPSSSDAQLIAGVMRRHSRLVAVVALGLLVVVFGGTYMLRGPVADRAAGDAAGRVSIADLKIEQLTTSGTAGGPAISPDGNYVAYVEQAAEGGGGSLRVRQVVTGSNVEIVPAEPGVRLAGPTVTPDGAFVNYLKVASSQSVELWQIPFLGGSPRRLLEGIGGRMSFSPDGKRTAYVRTTTSGTEVVIAGIDGHDAKVVAARRLPEAFLTINVVPTLTPFAPAWSPDGRTLAVMGARVGAAADEKDTGQVVFVDAQNGSERTINAGPPLIGAGLAWLDARWLVVSMLDRSSAPMQLWLLSYPDGEFRRLSNDLSQYVGASLTADRDGLVTSRAEFTFGIWTGDASGATLSQVLPDTPVKGPIGFGVAWLGDDLLYVANTSGGFALMRWKLSTQAAAILSRSAGDPSVSRDGSTIAAFDYDSGELFKIDASGGNRVVMRRGFGPRTRLTPDGRYVARADVDAAKGGVLRLYSVDGSGSVRDVTSDRVAGGAVEVSPDGRFIAFASVDDRKQPATAVCELAACSSRRMLPSLPRWHWTPDGRALAYVERRTQSDLWIQPLDGTAPRQLTHFANDGRTIADFAWSSDGNRLAVARSRSSNNIVLLRGFRRAQ